MPWLFTAIMSNARATVMCACSSVGDQACTRAKPNHQQLNLAFPPNSVLTWPHLAPPHLTAPPPAPAPPRAPASPQVKEAQQAARVYALLEWWAENGYQMTKVLLPSLKDALEAQAAFGRERGLRVAIALAASLALRRGELEAAAAAAGAAGLGQPHGAVLRCALKYCGDGDGDGDGGGADTPGTPATGCGGGADASQDGAGAGSEGGGTGDGGGGGVGSLLDLSRKEEARQRMLYALPLALLESGPELARRAEFVAAKADGFVQLVRAHPQLWAATRARAEARKVERLERQWRDDARQREWDLDQGVLLRRRRLNGAGAAGGDDASGAGFDGLAALASASWDEPEGGAGGGGGVGGGGGAWPQPGVDTASSALRLLDRALAAAYGAEDLAAPSAAALDALGPPSAPAAALAAAVGGAAALARDGGGAGAAVERALALCLAATAHDRRQYLRDYLPALHKAVTAGPPQRDAPAAAELAFAGAAAAGSVGANGAGAGAGGDEVAADDPALVRIVCAASGLAALPLRDIRAGLDACALALALPGAGAADALDEVAARLRALAAAQEALAAAVRATRAGPAAAPAGGAEHHPGGEEGAAGAAWAEGPQDGAVLQPPPGGDAGI